MNAGGCCRKHPETVSVRLLDKLDFEAMGFSLYFLASVPEGEKTPEPGSVEAHQYLWTYPGTTLEPCRTTALLTFAHDLA